MPEQQTVTNSAVIHGLCAMTLSQQYIARSGSPHDDKSSDHSLRSSPCARAVLYSARCCSGGCLLSCAFSVRGVYVYKTLSDHVLVLCGLYFLYYIHNEKNAHPHAIASLSRTGNYYPICSSLKIK